MFTAEQEEAVQRHIEQVRGIIANNEERIAALSQPGSSVCTKNLGEPEQDITGEWIICLKQYNEQFQQLIDDAAALLSNVSHYDGPKRRANPPTEWAQNMRVNVAVLIFIVGFVALSSLVLVKFREGTEQLDCLVSGRHNCESAIYIWAHNIWSQP
jgi:hypothetical protein